MNDEETDAHRPEGPLFSPLIEAAIRLAARGHYHQFRKHSSSLADAVEEGWPLPTSLVPYVTHLIGTMCILARTGARDETLAAAILHDYLEDVPDPDGRETIRRAVGARVLDLVLAVTENKRPDEEDALTWQVRKAEQIEQIERMPEEAVQIKAADVLHNLLSLLADLETAADKDSVWTMLNADPERQMWYFGSVLEAARRRLGEHTLVTELERAIRCVEPHAL